MSLNAIRIFRQLGCRSLFSSFGLTLAGMSLPLPVPVVASPVLTTLNDTESTGPRASRSVLATSGGDRRAAGWADLAEVGAGGSLADRPATYLLAQVQTPTGSGPAAPNVPHRSFIQWSGMRGPRLQIFIDSGQKTGARFRGASSDLAADLMLQMPGDGSAQLMRYAGSGEDWKWNVVEAHPVYSQPDQGTNRVEFDAFPLASSSAAKIQFRFLNKDWNPVSASRVLPWRPN